MVIITHHGDVLLSPAWSRLIEHECLRCGTRYQLDDDDPDPEVSVEEGIYVAKTNCPLCERVVYTSGPEE